MNRRELFRHAGAGAAAWTAASYSRVLGANERVRLGVVGCGGRGAYVTSVFQRNPIVDVVALCDVWEHRAERAKLKATQAKIFGDHRKTIESGVDALLIATPDHWHAPICIDALNAGKDVYCEKPLTLRIEEGPEVVKAARVNQRVCQVGMQQRSGPHYLRARDEFIKGGRLGKITLARTWWHGNGAHLLRVPEQLVNGKPGNLDWPRFLGPVKWRDWDPKQFANFRAYLDFGGGQITDLFTHWIDVVHMFMGQEIPISAVAGGGIYHYEDGRTAPDTINAILEYPGKWSATFEATLAPGLSGDGIEMVGTEGRLHITRGQFTFTPKERGAQPTVVKAEGSLDERHVNNFLDCMKSRKTPNGDVLIGHRAAQASHLANIAWVQKRRLRFDPEREEILPL
jgi:predicted dehydrogenase